MTKGENGMAGHQVVGMVQKEGKVGIFSRK